MSDKYKRMMYGLIFFLWFALVAVQMLVLVDLKLDTLLIIIISLSAVFFLMAVFLGIIRLSVLKDNFKFTIALFLLLILCVYCLNIYNRYIHYEKQVNARFGYFLVDGELAKHNNKLLTTLKRELADTDEALPVEYRLTKRKLYQNDAGEAIWYSVNNAAANNRLVLYELYTTPEQLKQAEAIFKRVLKNHFEFKQRNTTESTPFLKLAPDYN